MDSHKRTATVRAVILSALLLGYGGRASAQIDHLQIHSLKEPISGDLKDLGKGTSGMTSTSDWTHPYEPDAKTVALWHFDESSGRSVSDASGNAHVGEATNARIIPGQRGFGNSRSFADSPIGFADFGVFQIPQTEGTFEAWVRPLTRPPTSCDHSHFFIKGVDGNSASGFTFYVRIYNDGKIDAGTGESGGDIGISTLPGVISYSGVWQHFAFTWSPTGSHFYVNGNEVANGQAISVGKTRHPVALAKWGSSLYPDCRYLGEIDEVRISSVARTYTSEGDLSTISEFGQESKGQDQSLTTIDLPKNFLLGQNYPNPFNPTTTIKYGLPNDSRISLKVYDVLGREMLSLVDGIETAGQHEVTLNASSLPSGVYFYRLKAGSFTETKRLVLMK